MKDHKSMRNLIVALAFFVLWGNVISLMLPAEDCRAIGRLVDFGSLLFALAVLAAGLTGFIKTKRGAAGKKTGTDGSDRDGAA